MKLLLLLSCVAFAWAENLRADCEKKGPSYWCRDLITASQCGKVEYCHDNSWKDKAAVSCDVCTFVATIVDTLLEQNVTQQDAQTFVLKLCDSLGSLATECHSLVGKDFYIIWAFVVEEVDPSVICYKLGYCTGSKAVSKSPKGSVECDLCTFATQYLEKLMQSNVTKTQAESYVLELCTYLGSLAPECQAFIQTNFDSVWAMLESDLQPDIVCVKLNVCTSLQPSLKTISKPLQSNCEMCTILTEYIEAMMAKNVTKLEGEDMVMELCSYLGPLGPQCDVFVEAYFNTIWALLEKELEPNVICVLLNICTNAVPPAKAALSQPMSLHMPKGIISCDECKVLIDVVHGELEKSTTQAEAMMVALKVCSSLGGLDFLCSIIINDTFDTIWAAVVNDLSNSDKVCVFLEKCTSGEKASKQLLPEPSAIALTPALSSDPPCDLCVALVNYVADIGEKDNATIEKLAYGFCASFDDPVLVLGCQNLINTTFVDAWNLLLNSLNATKLCQQYKKCPSASRKQLIEATGVSDAAACQLCNAVVEYIEYRAAMNTTEAFAMAIAQIVCSQLGSLSDLCNEVVTKSFDQIWKRLVGDLGKASGLCQMEFCPQVKMSLVPAVSVPSTILQAKHTKRAAVSNDVEFSECDICKLVAYVADSIAMNNATKEEAEMEALNLCSLLGEYGPLCTEFVESNFQVIWALVIKDLEPNVICVYLKVCNATAQQEVQGSSSSKAVPSVSVCEVCKGISFLLDSLVKNNVSQVDAKALIDEECTKLGIYNQMCVTLVNDYFQDIWNLLINGLEPDFICAKLGLCSNSTSPSVEISSKQSFECTACEEMLVGMEGVVDQNTSEDQARALMEMFCSVLPPDLMSKCKDFVQADFFLAWDTFKECVDNPKGCCSEIGVCNSTAVHTKFFDERLATKKLKESTKDKSSELLCIVCEYMMKELDSILAENATEAEIQAALNKVCSLFPKSLTSYCDSMVAEYTPQIIKLLLQDTDPKMVCTRLGVCAQSSLAVSSHHTGSPHFN